MGISLSGMNLTDFAQCDAQWYCEVQAVQEAFQQGRKARQDADARKRELAG